MKPGCIRTPRRGEIPGYLRDLSRLTYSGLWWTSQLQQSVCDRSHKIPGKLNDKQASDTVSTPVLSLIPANPWLPRCNLSSVPEITAAWATTMALTMRSWRCERAMCYELLIYISMARKSKSPQPRTLSVFTSRDFTSERVSKFSLREPTDYYVTWELSDCTRLFSPLLDFGFASAFQIWASPMILYVTSHHLVADWFRQVATPCGKNVRQLNCKHNWCAS